MTCCHLCILVGHLEVDKLNDDKSRRSVSSSTSHVRKLSKGGGVICVGSCNHACAGWPASRHIGGNTNSYYSLVNVCEIVRHPKVGHLITPETFDDVTFLGILSAVWNVAWETHEDC